MATRFIAKHGLKSDINRLTLSEGEIAIAYSDDKSEAEILCRWKQKYTNPYSRYVDKNKTSNICRVRRRPRRIKVTSGNKHRTIQ